MEAFQLPVPPGFGSMGLTLSYLQELVRWCTQGPEVAVALRCSWCRLNPAVQYCYRLQEKDEVIFSTFLQYNMLACGLHTSGIDHKCGNLLTHREET